MRRQPSTTTSAPATSSSLASSFQPVDAKSIVEAFAHLPRQTRERKKRGYSTAYRPRGKGQRYLLDAIPSTLWRDVRAKASREGVSIRALILSLLEEWSERPAEQTTPGQGGQS